jgi:hypothetical protein
MRESTRGMEFRGVWKRGARGCALVMVKVGDHRGMEAGRPAVVVELPRVDLKPWRCWGLEPASILVGDILVVLLTGRKTRHIRHALSGSALVFAALF